MTELEHDDVTDTDVAIIGMAGRFPGARDLREFWRGLVAGAETVRDLTPEEIERAPKGLTTHPRFVARAAVLDDVHRFDHGFFGITKRDACWMDPQHRIFLECAWAAIEDAGYDADAYRGAIAVYAGARASGHLDALRERADDPATSWSARLMDGADKMAARVSYHLNLRGESIGVYTACSTGLVAVHLACQSLLTRQADMALAGAVKVAFPQTSGYVHEEGMICSPDGRCRAFDHRAAGTVLGEGVGAVLLKPLTDAIRDRDHVHAVIRGSALNNDGRLKVGFTAPSVDGQAEVVGRALAMAGVEPHTIGYVEAHGTATALGDPIEIAALTQAFRRRTNGVGFCKIGSVKTNIGHLDPAAGIAGLIKAALVAEHGVIPKSLHFEAPNPAIDFAGSPFRVAAESEAFPKSPWPRRVGVSSFGIGGTNAHAIVQQPPPRIASPSRRGAHVVTVSARSSGALDRVAADLAAFVENQPDRSLADVAYTRNVGRRPFAHRRAVVASDLRSLGQALRRAEPAIEVAPREVAFLLPGLGSQRAGMGAELCRCEPVFATAVDECASILGRRLGDVVAGHVDDPLDRPATVLPALFAFEYALARLWQSAGVAPSALLGHSNGEYVAACLAGVMDLEDALRVVTKRAELIESTPLGAMLAVGLAPEAIASSLSSGLAIAAVNASNRCVVSGARPEIEALARELARKGHACARLAASRGFHSPMLEPILPSLRDVLRDVRLRKPRIPFLSSVSGTWITDAEATSAEYWVAQTRSPVRFAAGLAELLAGPPRLLVDLGPDQALTQLCRPTARRAGTIVLACGNPSGPPSHESFLGALGTAWSHGASVDWNAYHACEERSRVPLPTYPFDVDGEVSRAAESHAKIEAPAPAEPTARSAVISSELAGTLSEIWKELLGTEVPPGRSVFELGADSLVAIQAASRIQERLGIEAPLQDIFEAPTVADLAQRLQSQLPASPALPAIRLSGDGSLSVVEERVWALEQSAPGHPAFVMRLHVHVEGELEPERFEDALNQVVARHAALRSRYAPGPRRLIDEQVRVPLVFHDLAHLAEAERAARLSRASAQILERPFDLQRAPLLRATLVRSGASEHVLVLALHHLVADVISFEILVGEALAAYDGRAASTPALGYDEFAQRQREWLGGAEASRDLDFWRAELSGHRSVIRLAGERPPRPSYAGSQAEDDVPEHVAQELAAFSAREGVTKFSAILAVYQLWLRDRSGEERFLVGTPVGNRDDAERAGVVGYVAHTIPLRADLSDRPSFRALVKRVSETVRRAFGHAKLPYEWLKARLDPEESAHLPLCSAQIVYHNFKAVSEMSGRRVSFATPNDGTPEWGVTLGDLVLMVIERADRLSLRLQWNGDVFDADRGREMLADFQRLLARVLIEKEAPHRAAPRRAMEFSLFYFADAETQDPAAHDKYKLLVEGAKFADRHGFMAVWTPERHFHSFGGLYPNPAVTSAALTTITEHVRIRAGSLVVPLHDPVRIAEEWSVLDNLSNGRVDVSFASGWHANDFVFAPQNYERRKEVMFDTLEEVRKLWRGDTVRRRNGAGAEVEVRIRPRPIQRELPVWIAVSNNPETFRMAGEAGANVLTILSGQSLDELKAKIRIYREARRKLPGEGWVTVMVYAYLDESVAAAKEKAKGPLLNYLRSSVGLMEGIFAALEPNKKIKSLSKEDVEAVVANGMNRYLESAGLFGSARDCLGAVGRLRDIGVDETACLIDFGLDVDSVMRSLARLHELKDLCAAPPRPTTSSDIPRRRPEDAVPLSYSQERLWRLQSADPTSPGFNVPGLLRIRGPLLHTVLERSLDALRERHESLRTAIREEGGRAIQLVHPFAPEPLAALRVGSEAEAVARARADVARPFDLARGRLFRPLLLEIDPRHHLLLVTLHHMVFDGWSFSVLVRDLAALYSAFAEGRTPELAPLDVQLGDYTLWQRATLQGRRFERVLGYWKKALHGMPARIALPATHQLDRPGAAGRRVCELPESTSRALHEFARREGVTPFAVLFAAYAAVVARYAGAKDFGVGVPIATRSHVALERLIGVLLSTVCLRVQIDPKTSFRALVQQATKAVRGAQAHVDIPYSRVVEEIDPARARSATPLFQFMFNLQNHPAPRTAMAGLEVEPVHHDLGKGKPLLELRILQDEGKLVAHWEFHTDIVGTATVEHLAARFEALLASGIARPDAVIDGGSLGLHNGTSAPARAVLAP